MTNHPNLVPFTPKEARLLSLPATKITKPAIQYKPRRQVGLPISTSSMLYGLKLYGLKPVLGITIAFVLLVIGNGPQSSVWASSSRASNNGPVENSVNAQSVVDSINQIRANSGLNQLAVNPHLTQAAQVHAVDMVTNHNHSHTGTDGSSVRMRIERTGYGAGNWSGENWVALPDATKAVEWWMNSPPHRANILNRSWQEIGIGSGINTDIGLNYFVVVFASKGEGYTVPASANNYVAPIQNQASAPLIIPEFHHVQQGETLSAIATRYALSWQALATINSLNEHSILSIGQAIRLPSGSAVGGPQRNATFQDVAYTVVTGDTLSAIAHRFDLPWQDIAFRNNLTEKSVLSIDQILQIPVEISELTTTVLNEVDAAAAATPATHTVQTGETIITIALQYELNWKELLNLNTLNDSTLLAVGQTIRLK